MEADAVAGVPSWGQCVLPGPTGALGGYRSLAD
jgi:hypothetical protein